MQRKIAPAPRANFKIALRSVSSAFVEEAKGNITENENGSSESTTP
jgi:hypothetical protein